MPSNGHPQNRHFARLDLRLQGPNQLCQDEACGVDGALEGLAQGRDESGRTELGGVGVCETSGWHMVKRCETDSFQPPP